jgi:DNA polymerase IV
MSSFTAPFIPLTGVTTSPSSLPTRWLHVDINSYFATLLQQENPALRNRPIGIVKGLGRTCIIAASKEAKKCGVKTGSSLREARQYCPDILPVPAQFDLYLSASIKLKKLFESLAPEVNVFSLDEAFINITDCRLIHPDAHALAAEVQRRIKAELGEWVTCNVGISHNRLLAKLTSEMSPKGSITEVTVDNKDALLAQATFPEVCGVGFRLEKRLGLLGITHPYQINFLSDAELNQHFGPFWGSELRKIGQGEETHFFTHVRTTLHMKSIGRSITGYRLCDSEVTIKRTLLNLTEEVIWKVRKLNLAGRLVSVSFRGPDGQHWHQHRTLSQHIRQVPDMFKVIYDELYQSWARPFPIIKFSVYLALLKPVELTPTLLWPEAARREKLYEAVDAINHRYGLYTMHSGTLLNAPLFKPEVTGFLGDKNFQLSRLD